jgi:hypothetical protein
LEAEDTRKSRNDYHNHDGDYKTLSEMTLMKAVGVAEQNKLFIGHMWLPLFFHFTKSNKKILNHTFTFILNTSKQIYRDNTIKFLKISFAVKPISLLI